jgi:L-ascorbate metabolism protein UlaG (beta-lactamase superfamily)
MLRQKKIIMGLALAALLFALAPRVRAESELEKLFAAPLGENEAAYMFLAFSGVVVRTAAGTVVIDPANLLMGDDISALAKHKIDALLYTHGHGDHYDAATAGAIVRATGTTVVADPDLAAKIKSSGAVAGDKVLAATSGRVLTVGAARIKGVTGRHVGPITLFHITLGGVTIFHGGDSAHVPVADCPSRLAFLPAGRPSPTASPAAALKMAQDVKPKVIVLVHGQDQEYAEFQKLAAKELPGVVVQVGAPFVVKVVRLD